jgi:hypothetical protein
VAVFIVEDAMINPTNPKLKHAIICHERSPTASECLNVFHQSRRYSSDTCTVPCHSESNHGGEKPRWRAEEQRYSRIVSHSRR